MKQLLLLLGSLCSGYSLLAQSSLVVPTSNGQLQGVQENKVRAFKGVPFAKPPVGALRWAAPQPMPSWKGIRKADVFGARSFQRNAYKDMVLRSPRESEDCLYLNVWTPGAAKDLPVLVYFHGGGLSSGDGSETRYDGV